MGAYTSDSLDSDVMWAARMLGYGTIAPQYPLEFPAVLREAGYDTVSIGKDQCVKA